MNVWQQNAVQVQKLVILLVKTAQIEEGTIQITISAELKDRHHMMGEVVFVKERLTCFCHIC